MLIYKAPIEEMRFVLETLGYDRVQALEAFEAYDLETVIAILEQSGKFCAQEMLPLNPVGDREGLKYDPETRSVTTPTGFKALYRKFLESGVSSIAQPEAYGGGGAPHTLAFMLTEMAIATNKSFSMLPGLAHGLVEALVAHGTEEQKQYYLPPIISGEWGATMCLTEPQCGTDLGLVRTKAEPEGDAYRLTGTKIWITFGEHDLTENIIHLVLARLPDAPPGIKGISAFLVPKILADGTRNGITCGGLEHKMGIHASPTCVMNLEDAVGYLVGEPHKGMRSMFTMMNSARLAVAIEGIALADIAYQTAVAFARDRRQSRALDPQKQDPDAPADCILVHPDVRRMLANIKATNEGMRALAYWVAMQIDVSHGHPDAEVRQRADDLVALLTPVAKSFLTERGFLCVSEAMQVTGGAGYTRDWPIEQYLRDMRIGLIYEGTNHIQALDLVGRKLPMHGGRLMRVFSEEVTATIRAAKEEPRMAELIEPLKKVSKQLTEATMALAGKAMKDPEEAGAVASNYLNLFGFTAVALMWARMAQAALAGGKGSEARLKTARYFFHNVLPEADGLVGVIAAGKQHMMAFDEDDF